MVRRYFGTRGRAEAIRLTFAEARVVYEESTFTPEEWPEVKEKGVADGSLPFGQLPVVSVGFQLHLAQSHAILRYLGRKYGMYQGTNEELARIDMIVDGVEDMRRKYSALVYDPEFSSKKDAYLADIKVWLGYMENFRKHSHGEFIVGDTFSIADIALFDILDVNMRISSAILDGFPYLKTHYSLTKSRPNIAAYLASGSRPVHGNGKRAYFDNVANPSTEGLP